MESAGKGKFFFAVAPSGGEKGLFDKMALAVGQGKSREKREKKDKKTENRTKKREKIEENQKKKRK